ncbi:hypothetical protein CENSYa_0143 [Cenarchaeum symbiosum A]|uniref:Uncharacterized protein n=1 Tax=Cenarchaeum symbiosum (strain A) TaxID=414004 RepID=A0RTX1_CENSY|nr:hypothetical protein CENSYa_0143 [Cenarchaeum symbiosum A]
MSQDRQKEAGANDGENVKTAEFSYRKDEGLVAGYATECVGQGPGILYITTQRLVFYSQKHGIRLNLDYEHLFDWRIIGDTLKIRWQELKHGQAQHRLEDEIFELVFLFKSGYEWIIHMIIYATYTSRFPTGNAGLGWYLNEKAELLHRYDDEPRVYDVKLPLCIRDITLGIDMENKLTARAKILPPGEDFRIDDHTGELILEQSVYKWLKIRHAQRDDGTWSCHEGYIRPGSIKDNGKGIIMDIIKNEVKCEISDGITAHKELIDDITAGKVEASTAFIPAVKLHGEEICAADDLEDRLKYLAEKLVVMPRVYELMKGEDFEYTRQAALFRDELQLRLTMQLRAGKDITGFAPDIQKAPQMRLKDGISVADVLKKYRGRLIEDGMYDAVYGDHGPDPDVEKHLAAHEYWYAHLPDMYTYEIPESRLEMEARIDAARSDVEENSMQDGMDMLAREGIIKDGWDHSKSALYNRANLHEQLERKMANPNSPLLMEDVDKISLVTGRFWTFIHLIKYSERYRDDTADYLVEIAEKMNSLRISKV